MNARAFSAGLAAIAAIVALPAIAQQPQPARMRPIRDALDVLIFRPPPSVVYSMETPASRMARYYQLGGGVGPMPGESNGPSAGFLLPGASDIPGWSVPMVPGAGRDPAISAANRERVLNRYQAWRSRAYPAER